MFAHDLPVVGKLVERGEVQAGVPRRVLQRGNNRVQVRLAGRAGHGRNGEIDDVHVRVGGFEYGAGVHAAGVVRVEMDRDADFFLQGLDQLIRRIGPAQSRHVLDRENVRAHLFQFLRELDVILQRVLRASRIEDVAGVADRRFANRVRLLHRLHRDREIRRVVERVEHAEDVHALRGGVPDEAGHDVVGVIRVAHGVRAAKEHLETDVRNFRAQLAQTFPRVFVQEAHRRVEGRAAPHLQAEQLRRALRHGVRHGQHVVAADARGHQGLMRVAEGRVGDEQPFLFRGPFGKFFRAKFKQQLAGAFGRFELVVAHRGGGRRPHSGDFVTLGLRVAVDDDVAEEVQQPGRAVAARFEGEQLRRGVNQSGGCPAGLEDRVVDEVFQEREVRFHAANAELAQRAVHALAGGGKVAAGRRHFHQQ